ncbi:hypothetical protein FGO68_gene16083 [Halteria grandinella]|uniref:Uncharacterized protein n=1 Tax=Halteria grandinella TaxID=5974 RepID=A0A8J8T643_HALGN|nr:hypothetical protein FGO68_gene16083 [Halteria grandinella]
MMPIQKSFEHLPIQKNCRLIKRGFQPNSMKTRHLKHQGGRVNLKKLMISNQNATFDQVKQFLEKKHFLKDLELKVSNNKYAQLLENFMHVKFNFDLNSCLFTFKQLYTYLHPECKQIGIPG